MLSNALTEIKLAFCYTCNERPPVVPPPTMYGPDGLPPAHDEKTGVAGLPTGNPERLALHNALLNIVDDVARGPCTWSKVVKNARGWLMSKSWLEKRGLPSPETVYYTMDRNAALLGFNDDIFYFDEFVDAFTYASVAEQRESGTVYLVSRRRESQSSNVDASLVDVENEAAAADFGCSALWSRTRTTTLAGCSCQYPNAISRGAVAFWVVGWAHPFAVW